MSPPTATNVRNLKLNSNPPVCDIYCLVYEVNKIENLAVKMIQITFCVKLITELKLYSM